MNQEPKLLTKQTPVDNPLHSHRTFLPLSLLQHICSLSLPLSLPLPLFLSLALSPQVGYRKTNLKKHIKGT